MKFPTGSSTAAILLLIAISVGAGSLDKRIADAKLENSSAAWSAIGAEIDESFASDPEAYFHYHEQMESVLEAMAVTNHALLKELGNQIHKVLTKNCSQAHPRIAIACVRAKYASVQRVARVSQLSKSKALILDVAVFLGQVREMIEPGYKRLFVSDNVAPPLPFGGPSNAGMDPKVITDRKAREAYEKAIEENLMASFKNKLQLDLLPQANRNVWSILLRLYEDETTRVKLSAGEFENMAKAARLSDEERQALCPSEGRK